MICPKNVRVCTTRNFYKKLICKTTASTIYTFYLFFKYGNKVYYDIYSKNIQINSDKQTTNKIIFNWLYNLDLYFTVINFVSYIKNYPKGITLEKVRNHKKAYMKKFIWIIQ